MIASIETLSLSLSLLENKQIEFLKVFCLFFTVLTFKKSQSFTLLTNLINRTHLTDECHSPFFQIAVVRRTSTPNPVDHNLFVTVFGKDSLQLNRQFDNESFHLTRQANLVD